MTILPTRTACLALALTASIASAASAYWPPISETPTERHDTGRFIWADLVTSDVGAAIDFYGKTFGWTFETYGGAEDQDTYTLVLAAGNPIGGMVFHDRADPQPGAGARWIGLISTPDAAAVAKRIVAHGGKTLFGPAPLGERGDVAVFADPEGALFGAVRTKSGDPEDFVGAVGEWLWIELWTDDAARAVDFYRAAFGYEAQPLEDSPRTAFRLKSGDRVRAGVVQKDPETKAASVWLPYVRVADVAATIAKATAAGGRVAVTPRPYSGATVAVIVDPSGAPFAIAQLPTEGGK